MANNKDLVNALTKCLEDAREELYMAQDRNDTGAREKWYRVVRRIQDILVLVDK